jgi:hypothetical protein
MPEHLLATPLDLLAAAILLAEHTEAEGLDIHPKSVPIMTE